MMKNNLRPGMLSRLVMLFALLCLPFGGSAQEIDYSYIKIDAPKTLNLPTLELSMELPAGTSYLVPFRDDYHAYLDLKSDAQNNYYFFSGKSFKCIFTFALPNSTMKDITLQIVPVSKEFSDKQIAEAKQNNSITNDLPALKTGIGKMDGYQLSDRLNNGRMYVAAYQDMSLLFKINTQDPKAIQDAEAMIMSLNHKICATQLDLYNERVKNGEF